MPTNSGFHSLLCNLAQAKALKLAQKEAAEKRKADMASAAAAAAIQKIDTIDAAAAAVNPEAGLAKFAKSIKYVWKS